GVMGTRADFWIGYGADAEWLGSVAWDGYEWDEDPSCPVMTAKTADEFREAVRALLEPRTDATYPEQGWPWPWNDSALTDYAYVFHNGKVHSRDHEGEWRDMSAQANVQIGGERSGIFLIRGA